MSSTPPPSAAASGTSPRSSRSPLARSPLAALPKSLPKALARVASRQRRGHNERSASSRSPPGADPDPENRPVHPTAPPAVVVGIPIESSGGGDNLHIPGIPTGSLHALAGVATYEHEEEPTTAAGGPDVAASTAEPVPGSGVEDGAVPQAAVSTEDVGHAPGAADPPLRRRVVRPEQVAIPADSLAARGNAEPVYIIPSSDARDRGTPPSDSPPPRPPRFLEHLVSRISLFPEAMVKRAKGVWRVRVHQLRQIRRCNRRHFVLLFRKNLKSEMRAGGWMKFVVPQLIPLGLAGLVCLLFLIDPEKLRKSLWVGTGGGWLMRGGGPVADAGFKSVSHVGFAQSMSQCV